MNAHDTGLHPARVIIQGLETSRDFRGNAELEVIVSQLLTASGYSGDFNLRIISKIKGSPHTKGFQLGNPVLRNGVVEVKWQMGGNDSRFMMYVHPPLGVDLMEFYERLNNTIKTQEAKGVLKDVPPDYAVEGPKDSPYANDPLTGEDLELFFREAVPNATQGGVVTRDDCDRYLTLLGRGNLDAVVDKLIADGHLKRGATKKFLVVSTEWLARVREGKEPEPAPAPSAKLPSLQGGGKSTDLLAEVRRLSELAAFAAGKEAELSPLQQEALTLSETISAAETRLAQVRTEIADIESALANPDVKGAAETLAELKKLIGG